MVTYRVSFDRIGRNRQVPALITQAADGYGLAETIAKYAREHIASRGFEVDIDLETGNGMIVCGMHCGGRFTIEKIAE